MPQVRSTRNWVYLTVVTGITLITLHISKPDIAIAQNNQYRLIADWAQIPDGFTWGQLIAVAVDADSNLIAFQRCSSNTCVDQSAPPLLKFSPTGEHLMSWGEGMMVWPHGLDIDSQGNIWVTDGRHEGEMGQVIHKFSADGELLMTIGTPGVAGSGAYTFNGICDVVVADNGDIFVADGHFNNRVAKFSADGEFIKSWGQPGRGPGEFDMPHSIDIDSQGRVFVADRGNSRIQIFDQEGRYLDSWRQFGRPSGIFITEDDRLFVADSQSVDGVNPDFEMGIYYGSAVDGTVTGYIGDIWTESVTEDAEGNLFSGLVEHRGLVRYELQ